MTEQTKTEADWLAAVKARAAQSTTVPDRCPECHGDGSIIAMFDGNCPCAWAHGFIFNRSDAREDVPRLLAALTACTEALEKIATVPCFFTDTIVPVCDGKDGGRCATCTARHALEEVHA